MLETPEKRPLIEFFLDNQKCYNMKYISGSMNPMELVAGHHANFYDSAWRLNSFSTQFNFKMRLGGYFHELWAQYGNDQLGQMCSAEMVGFGLTDQHWQPQVYGKKAFGVRQGHD